MSYVTFGSSCSSSSDSSTSSDSSSSSSDFGKANGRIWATQPIFSSSSSSSSSESDTCRGKFWAPRTLTLPSTSTIGSQWSSIGDDRPDLASKISPSDDPELQIDAVATLAADKGFLEDPNDLLHLLTSSISNSSPSSYCSSDGADDLMRISKYPDTPISMTRAIEAHRAYHDLRSKCAISPILDDQQQVVGTELLVEASDPQGFHRAAYRNTKDQHLGAELGDLYKIYGTANYKPAELGALRQILNVDHLTEKNHVGYHFCPSMQPEYQELLQSGILMGEDGVFQSSFVFDASQPPKISTFFPSSVSTVSELIETVLSAEKIAQKADSFLCSIPGVNYKVEMYKNGPLINSCFPVFRYHQYDVGVDAYPIVHGMAPINRNELLNAAIRAIHEYYLQGKIDIHKNPVRYVLDNGDLVVDIAPILRTLAAEGNLPDYGVFKGVLVQFPQVVLYADATPNILTLKQLDEISNEHMIVESSDSDG